MIRSVDVKSLLIGALLLALVLCMVGAVPFMEPEYYGRFQIETNPGHAFVLDTATGQVWTVRAYSSDSHSSMVDPNSNFSLPKAGVHVGIPRQ